MPTLEKRITHKYVGAYRHLDQWEAIGTYEVTERLPAKMMDDDGYEHNVYRYRLRVNSPATRKMVCEALEATYSQRGCAHDYDCCGCPIRRASARWIRGDEFKVKIDETFNY